jgi:hypothetical protein
MTDPEYRSPAAFALRTMRIIHVALCLGVVILAVIMVTIRDPQRPAPTAPILTYVGVGFLVAIFLPMMIVPASMATAARRRFLQGGVMEGMPASAFRDPDFYWAMVYQTRLIVVSALLEGAAFYQLIAYYIEGKPLSLGLAGGLFVLLVLQFPTRDGLASWTERQRDLVEQEKQGNLG